MIIFQYSDKKKKYVIFFLKKVIIQTTTTGFFFKETFFQEIFSALGKIIYFIYKIILFFLYLTEIKK